MGIDFRLDHSLRIPRPDLSMQFNTPNACTQCHSDKTDQWAEEAVTKWYGIRRRPHYGTVFAKARKGEAEARDHLVGIANDVLFPPIVRSTALSLLRPYQGEMRDLTFRRALDDDKALIRHTALRNYTSPDPEMSLRLLAPLLYDPVKGVRMEAAANLVSVADQLKSKSLKKAYASALEEYTAAMRYSLDFAFAGHNLGNMYRSMGRMREAETHYLRAIRIDDAFLPAKINLAMLYNQEGNNKAAEKLFREVLTSNPEFHEAAYSLGLLLAENRNYEEAALYLERAAAGMPERARVHYNLGLLQQYLNRQGAAETSLKRAVGLEPGNLDFLYALADFLIKQERWLEAEGVAKQMVEKYPDMKLGQDILNYIHSRQ
jgi:tetratricopeptide (TPR) repeat protein